MIGLANKKHQYPAGDLECAQWYAHRDQQEKALPSGPHSGKEAGRRTGYEGREEPSQRFEYYDSHKVEPSDEPTRAK